MGRNLNKGKEKPADGGRKAGVEVVKLGLQIANSITISMKLCLCSEDPCIELIFLPKEFIEMGKYRFARALHGGDFGDQSLDGYSELLLALGSALGPRNRSHIVHCSSKIARGKIFVTVGVVTLRGS